MTVSFDPIWPWSQLLSSESHGGTLGWLLAHSTSLLLVGVPLLLIVLTIWTYLRSGASASACW